MMLPDRLRPASVARLVGVVVPEDRPAIVVELSVGSAELLFEGECNIVVGLWGLAPTVKLLVTCARSSSTLSV